jgi:hypothetical protein
MASQRTTDHAYCNNPACANQREKMDMNQDTHQNLDESLAAACKEWLKGCTCAPADAPQQCAECTNAFLESLVHRAQQLGLPVGENAINGTPR